MATRHSLTGWAFISPWVVGVTIFFLSPFFTTVKNMFGKIEFDSSGIVYKYVGLENIREVFFRNPDNGRMIIENLGTSIASTVLVLVLSLFIAILLNQKFRGRGIIRALFTLPIIMSSGVLLMVFKSDQLAAAVSVESGSLFQSSELETVLLRLGVASDIINAMTSTVNSVMDVIWRSGVQILLFLAGLQSVPHTLYEVCDVEGATKWQQFCKITFPLLSPYLVLNAVYSIIESFTFYDNKVTKEVVDLFQNLYYGQASVFSVAYFLIIFLLIGVILLLSAKRTVYLEK